jgi:hypothetical protein
VAARLDGEGATLPVVFVRDVLEKYLEELDSEWRAVPSEQAVVRRVAGALYEDESVVGRVLEVAHRELGDQLYANADPREEGELVEDGPSCGGRSR